MTYTTFSDIISHLQAHSKLAHDAYKLGIDLSNFHENLYVVINSLMKEVYGKEGSDWIEWFCYEQHEGMPKAQDADGNPICYDVESLWKYLEKS